MPKEKTTFTEKVKKVTKKYVLPAVVAAGTLAAAYHYRDDIKNLGVSGINKLMHTVEPFAREAPKEVKRGKSMEYFLQKLDTGDTSVPPIRASHTRGAQPPIIKPVITIHDLDNYPYPTNPTTAFKPLGGSSTQVGHGAILGGRMSERTKKIAKYAGITASVIASGVLAYIYGPSAMPHLVSATKRFVGASRYAFSKVMPLLGLIQTTQTPSFSRRQTSNEIPVQEVISANLNDSLLDEIDDALTHSQTDANIPVLTKDDLMGLGNMTSPMRFVGSNRSFSVPRFGPNFIPAFDGDSLAFEELVADNVPFLQKGEGFGDGFASMMQNVGKYIAGTAITAQTLALYGKGSGMGNKARKFNQVRDIARK